MLAEIGHLFLIAALCFSVLLCVLPTIGIVTKQQYLMYSAKPLVLSIWLFSGIAFICLIAVFLQDDFSVELVANNSNSLLPYYYKFTAVWGNHEGSLLLWSFVLNCWMLAVAMLSRSLPLDFITRVHAVLGGISTGFLSFLILTSNPFTRHLPMAPQDGQDLNPLLQDFAMIIHPPTLYLGYVGFSVAFAFAIAALTTGRLDAAWARWSRPWTNMAWVFLTLGIMLGSWWAYYELGWGGWWFWDPVENASFVPWLMGTALVHSLSVTEKRGALKSWTVLLAIGTFSMSLLGTFLVRSGVLTSVHSFAADPERGVFILGFLAIVVGGSLLLYAIRAPATMSKVSFGFSSREFIIFTGNVFLFITSLLVLLGTLFPLIMDALNQGKYSVGPPYFDTVFFPLMAIILLLMAFSSASQWRKTSLEKLTKKAKVISGGFVVTGVMVLLLQEGYSWQAPLGSAIAAGLLASIVNDLFHQTRHGKTLKAKRKKITPAWLGMSLAHLGMVVTALGVVFSSVYGTERDIRLAEKESFSLHGYRFTSIAEQHKEGPNYTSDVLTIQVTMPSGSTVTMEPQKRFYKARGTVMTEAAIDPGLFRDVYLALGERLEPGVWAVRIRIKPLVRWIWLGAIFMALGGIISVLDKRYRSPKKTQANIARV